MSVSPGAPPPPPGGLYAADGHRLLRELGTRFESRFSQLGADWLGYPGGVLARRHTQKLLAEVMTPFRRELKRRASLGQNWRGILEETRLRLGDFSVDPGTGSSRVRLSAVLRWIGVFIAYWFYVAANAALALRLRAGAAAPGTLLHGVGRENLVRGGNDASFMAFVTGADVTPLREAERLFVQAVEPVTATERERVSYARYPLIDLLRWRGLTPRELAAFLARHVRSAAAFARALAAYPAACILARDFAFDAAARRVNESGGLKAVVLTGSNFLEQMLWMSDLPGRTFRSHMAFYSVNGMSFVYKAHPLHEHNMILAYMRVDEFWVWTPGQADIVREWVPGVKYNVAGPILFYQPSRRAAERHAGLTIAVFDITPLSPELIERIGVIHPYYTTATTTAFIRDVLAARDACARELGVDISLVVKPKRKYERVHSTDYIDFLLELESRDGVLRILDAYTDLPQLIAASDLVITLPYSSPPYIAAPMGVPSIYYDASRELMPTHDPHPLIRFAGDAPALRQAMKAALSEALARDAREAATR